MEKFGFSLAPIVPMNFKLPPLPFEPNALSGWLSQETIDYHYGKHHRGYVEKLNALIPSSGFESLSLETIIREAKAGPLFNNAAQAWNHTFYWLGLRRTKEEATTNTLERQPELAGALTRSFGSTDKFSESFAKAATELFGSGWVWLCVDKTTDSLVILKTSNAENPMQQGLRPLLTCDVWEHAYYIDFRNKRADYVAGFMKAINWEFVAQNLKNDEVVDLTSLMRNTKIAA